MKDVNNFLDTLNMLSILFLALIINCSFIPKVFISLIPLIDSFAKDVNES